jgi:non-ribosomal peptide synthetase component E (peptide arylation enzyme)
MMEGTARCRFQLPIQTAIELQSSDFLNSTEKNTIHPREMGNYSEGHICQCLSRLATARRNAVVTISGDRQKTGEQFVEEVLCLARGLLELGLRAGDIVAISAFNRFESPVCSIL